MKKLLMFFLTISSLSSIAKISDRNYEDCIDHLQSKNYEQYGESSIELTTGSWFEWHYSGRQVEDMLIELSQLSGTDICTSIESKISFTHKRSRINYFAGGKLQNMLELKESIKELGESLGLK